MLNPEDIQAEVYQNSDLLNKIVEFSKKQKMLEAEILEHTEILKQKNQELLQVAGGYGVEGALVSLLKEAGVSELKLQDGSKVTIKDELKAPSMAAESEQRQPMIDWLENNGQGGVVKNEFKVPFNKGDVEKIRMVEMFLTKAGILFNKYSTVHPQTLKALLNELLEKGEDIPMEQLGIQKFQRTKVS